MDWKNPYIVISIDGVDDLTQDLSTYHLIINNENRRHALKTIQFQSKNSGSICRGLNAMNPWNESSLTGGSLLGRSVLNQYTLLYANPEKPYPITTLASGGILAGSFDQAIKED